MPEQLAEVIGARFEVAERVVIVTASIGITLCAGGRAAEDLVREADTAMYAAKAMGRAGYELFTAEQGTRVTDRLLVENELRVALDHREMWLAYQPKVAPGVPKVRSSLPLVSNSSTTLPFLASAST